MTRFEMLSRELNILHLRRAICCIGPGIAVGILIWYAMDEQRSEFAGLIAVGTVAVASVVFHLAGRYLFPAYARWCARASDIVSELSEIRAKMRALFARHPKRQKGQQFKMGYKLRGNALEELEESLSIGMYREEREVFVTAFMRDQIAVWVTASIGSRYQCEARDDPGRWADHVEELGCDSIRQYHNHPAHDGTTRPSPTDLRSERSFRKVLGPHADKLRSFIICWNTIGEWKIIEYQPDGRCWFHSEFDASAKKIPAAEVLSAGLFRH